MRTPVLSSIHVGLPASLGVEGAAEPMDRSWVTGLFKEAVPGPIHLGFLNLEGDGQADLRRHGGVDKAVCVYPLSRYPYWQKRLERALPIGGFGENFSVSGQDEDSVCLGDIFALGESTVQVSQPRSPCWKIARRWRVLSLAQWVQETGFTGWYLRVIQPGLVEPGQAFVLKERAHPTWTIAHLNKLRYGRLLDSKAIAALAECDALTAGWRQRFRHQARSPDVHRSTDENERLRGKNT